MKNKLLAVLSILILVGMLPGAAFAAPKLPDYIPFDVGPELREWEPTPARIVGSPDDVDIAAATAAAVGTPYYDCIIDVRVWMSLDNVTGFYFFDAFYLIAETAGSELWVQADLSYPEGDPRPEPMVTCEQAQYLLGEFDNNMYPVETGFFGTPDFHDGTYSLLEELGYFDPGTFYNEAGRQVVLVSNFIDEAYYDPTYPNYIAGFYSPSFEAYFDRNIMSIDSHDWVNRVGPDGSRPYLYESVFAHEYQHLLHDDYDNDEESWINEGLSMFSEYLTGYVVNEDNYTTFQENPENSLVVWEDQGGREIVADYGMVFLYQMYQYEKFGKEFIQYEFHNQDNSITSINSTLAAFNIQKDFADLYHDFAVAVLIDSKQANYRYGFRLLDVGIDIGTVADPNPEAFNTPGAPPWGTDYIWLTGKPKDLGKFTFNGVDYGLWPSSWQSTGDVLWAGGGNLMNNLLILPATGGGTLTFDTYYDIENHWDFGFVQVSTDGGDTWTSLENTYTTFEATPDAIETALENLPGLTGWSEDWIPMSFDLTAYEGQDILIAFRYVTDWFTYNDGWYVDNISVDGVLISDGTSTEDFILSPELQFANQNFTVTFVGFKGQGKGMQYKVHTMKLDDMTEQGLFELSKVLSWSDQAVMLVTFDAPEGFNSYANYEYELVYKTQGPKKK